LFSVSSVTCDRTTSRCVCSNAGEGICRFGGGYRCDVCCPGGSGQCPGDRVCRNDFGNPTCNCPPNTGRCQSGDPFKCTRDLATDVRRCGFDCIDCVALGASWCCGGRCGSAPGPGAIPSPDLPCREGCQPCQSGTICCRPSAGSPLYGCVLPDSRDGVSCPRPADG
jgi:hypothetical protein